MGRYFDVDIGGTEEVIFGLHSGCAPDWNHPSLSSHARAVAQGLDPGLHHWLLTRRYYTSHRSRDFGCAFALELESEASVW